MPRDGSLILSDICEPTLKMICERCGRYGRYSVARLIAAHGADAKLTDPLVTLANCETARSVSVHDRCKAKFEGFSFRSNPSTMFWRVAAVSVHCRQHADAGCGNDPRCLRDALVHHVAHRRLWNGHWRPLFEETR